MIPNVIRKASILSQNATSNLQSLKKCKSRLPHINFYTRCVNYFKPDKSIKRLTTQETFNMCLVVITPVPKINLRKY